MRTYKRWVWLSAIMALSLLAGTIAPVSILADNAKTIATSANAPDLIIETITWSPESPIIGDTVTFTVTIKNQGSSQAGSSRVAYYIDETYQTSAYVTQIDQGAAVTKTFTWEAQAGPYTFNAVADYNNEIAESDETNNDKAFAFSVLAPDLIIKSITWSPENPSVREQVTFTVTIKNQGNAKAGSSNVDFYIDGYSRGYVDVPRIEVGANVTKTFNWPAQAGSHTVKAVADILNQAGESDETNNDKTVIYSTSAPDLVIQDITWSPTDISENTLITFTVTIKNQGSGKAEHSSVSFYLDNIYQSSAFVNPIDSGGTVANTFNGTAMAGLHTVMAVADSDERLIESDETNNGKTVVLPTLAADLIIQDITWSPTSPLIAHVVTFTVSIKNQGKSESGASRVYLYIDNAYRLHHDVPGMDAGGTVTRTFPWIAKTNSHVIKAVVDEENYINEGDESNNEKTVTVNFSQASPANRDLIIQDIVWSPVNPSIEDTVTFTVTIKNQGSDLASPFHIAYYADDTYLTSAPVNQIDPGGITTKTFTWKAQAGSHTIKAVLDEENQVTESDEANNEKEVVLSAPALDLVIQDITWSPVSPSTGDPVTFTVTIKNQGSTGASHSRIAYYINGSSRGYHDVPAIDAGATATTTFTWTAQTGIHTIKAIADMENQVAESDEVNNEKTVTFPGPDLVIESLTWSPLEPIKGDTVTFSITIKNLSGGRAKPSSVYFHIDDSSSGYQDVQEIDAGATATTTFTWTAQTGSHTITAVADKENQVTESDEANNEKVVTFSVLQPPADALPPGPTPVSTTSPGQQEESAHLNGQSNEASPGQDTAFNPPEVPLPANPPGKIIWLNWWPVPAVIALGGIVAAVILRLRQRPHKSQ